MTQIKNNIYAVGILNPNMRIFDIVMKTEYGTSYNAYIVKGDKIALIDASHNKFSDKFIENISEVCNPKDIDYIIVNHCEPDHTGSLVNVLKLATKSKIYATTAGAIYLKNITNIPNLEIHVIKDNETLDLGQNKTLQFISAPLLHWPDSMFTYLQQDKVIFTCDFLGSHYCEPYIFDKNIKYVDDYKSALKNYFDCIFGPFLPYVKNGLDKISKLSIDYVCNSHGPILSKDGQLPYVIEKYTE
jgi:flavorubredoxin